MLTTDTHAARDIQTERKGDRKYGKKSAAKELLEKVIGMFSFKILNLLFHFIIFFVVCIPSIFSLQVHYCLI